MSGSPLETDSPSFFSHLSSVPVCCATPRAGMITFVGMVLMIPSGPRLCDDRAVASRCFYSIQRSGIVQVRLRFACRRECSTSGKIVRAGHEQLFRGKPRDDFTPILGHND